MTATTRPVGEVERLHGQAREAYWKRKDIGAAVGYLREGIRVAMKRAEGADGPRAAELKGWAKTCAYDLASFTWPGWNEEGYRPTREQAAEGREAAALNLRLALELNRPADRVADAHWLVGAHALTAEEYEEAGRSFAESRRLDTRDEQRRAAVGYAALARMLARPGDPEPAAEFDRAVRSLREVGTEDGKFLADQLVSVRAYFVKGRRRWLPGGAG